MAQNINPIYTLTGVVAFAQTDGDGGAAGPLKTANAAKDGTGTVLSVATGNTNGTYIDRIIARPVGTNTASVLRVFVNIGATNATIGNNCLIAELALPATTLTEVAAQPDYVLSLGLVLPSGYKILVTLGTTVAAGYVIGVIAGDY